VVSQVKLIAEPWDLGEGGYQVGNFHLSTGLSDIGWFRPDGPEMTPADWQTGFKSLGVVLNGDALPDPDRRGHRISDDTLRRV
jgi:pullulanase/glycogen debranching enzyme